MRNAESNNQRLKALLERARLKQSTALTLLNRGRRSPIADSTFRAWMTDPVSTLWRAMSDQELAECERAFAADLHNSDSGED